MAGPWDEFSGKPWEDYGKPGSIADFPNAPGFASTVKRTAGNMLTTGATSIEGITGPNAVTGAIRNAGQGIIDRNPEGIRSIGDIADSPWLTVKETVGQLVPQVGAAAAGAAGGAAVGRRVAGAPGAAIGAGIGSLLPILSQEYGGIYDDQPEGQKDKGRALVTALGATALERVGMGKLLKGLRGELPPMAKIPAEIAKGFAREGGTEAAQTAIEQVGAFKDPTTSESMQEQAFAGVMGGIGGGVLGGVHAGAQKVFGKTKSGETTDSADLESPAAAPAPAPATPQAIRAQKLPETGPLSGAVNAGIEAQAQGLEAAAGQQPLTEDEMLAAEFHVEQRRQDGTPAGQRFAAEFDAGRVSPREALEAFRLTQSPEFALPQPGVDAAEIDPAAAGALVAPGVLPQSELLPVGQATEVPVDVVEPAAPIEEPLPPAAPPRTLRDAQAKRAAEKAQQQEAASAQPAPVPAAEAPAAQQQPAPAAPAGAAPAATVAQPAPVAAPASGQLIEHVTGKGKTIRGVIRSDLTQDEAIAIDSGTFKKDGPNGRGYFIRERSLDKLAAHDARKQNAEERPATPVAESQAPAPSEPGDRGVAPAQDGVAPPQGKPSEKWHYRSTEPGMPMREIPAERMKDAREVSDLVPGLRFLLHRDMGDGKTWSVTERNTGLSLTTGHTTVELADFAARQRVQQVGADKVQARVRETLQKSGLSEGEALGVTAEPRKGKVPGLDEVVAAYKRAAGGDLDANMNATAVAFHRALADQNVKTIRDLAHPDNPKSRAVIEALSGKKLARGAMQSANIAEGWLRSLHPKPVTPQVPAPAPNAAAPVSTQAPAQAGATVAAAPATPTDPVAKRRAVLQALRDCIAG